MLVEEGGVRRELGRALQAEGGVELVPAVVDEPVGPVLAAQERVTPLREVRAHGGVVGGGVAACLDEDDTEGRGTQVQRL